MSQQNPNDFDDFDEFDRELHGLFTRATAGIAPRHDLSASVQQRLARGGSAHAGSMFRTRRSFSIAAPLCAALVVALLAGVLHWFGAVQGGAPTRITGSAPTHAPTATSAPLTVTSVDLTVSPASVVGKPCGSAATFTYTVTFHIPAGTTGGTIQFGYTLNNGRSQASAAVTVGPGQASATYTFTSSGTLLADHTYPSVAMVMVTNPNNVSSPQVKPSGACS